VLGKKYEEMCFLFLLHLNYITNIVLFLKYQLKIAEAHKLID